MKILHSKLGIMAIAGLVLAFANFNPVEAAVPIMLQPANELTLADTKYTHSSDSKEVRHLLRWLVGDYYDSKGYVVNIYDEDEQIYFKVSEFHVPLRIDNITSYTIETQGNVQVGSCWCSTVSNTSNFILKWRIHFNNDGKVDYTNLKFGRELNKEHDLIRRFN